MLKDTDQFGFNAVPIDPDGIVRRGLLMMDDQNRMLYSFALRVALLYLQPEEFTLNPTRPMPIISASVRQRCDPLKAMTARMSEPTGGYHIVLDFKGLRASLPTYPLNALLSGQVDAGIIKTKSCASESTPRG